MAKKGKGEFIGENYEKERIKRIVRKIIAIIYPIVLFFACINMNSGSDEEKKISGIIIIVFVFVESIYIIIDK